jgi:hypothetical protein
MKVKKIILLFLALLFPACIFLFLKQFGKNEFAVAPLFVSEYPKLTEECGVSITLPYRIADSVKSSLTLPTDKLSVVLFSEANNESETQLKRVMSEYGQDVKIQRLADTAENAQLKRCVFFLSNRDDLVLVDGTGLIRGHYISNDREEIDRLLTEIAIILKRY